jgi:hypothetical protein
MAANGSDSAAAIVGRLRRTEAELETEKRLRRAAEHKAAGLSSAVRKLQLLIAKQRTAEAERRAEHAC